MSERKLSPEQIEAIRAELHAMLDFNEDKTRLDQLLAHIAAVEEEVETWKDRSRVGFDAMNERDTLAAKLREAQAQVTAKDAQIAALRSAMLEPHIHIDGYCSWCEYILPNHAEDCVLTSTAEAADAFVAKMREQIDVEWGIRWDAHCKRHQEEKARTVARVRSEAFEEAAKIAEGAFNKHADLSDGDTEEHIAHGFYASAAGDLADAIRAAAQPAKADAIEE